MITEAYLIPTRPWRRVVQSYTRMDYWAKPHDRPVSGVQRTFSVSAPSVLAKAGVDFPGVDCFPILPWV